MLKRLFQNHQILLNKILLTKSKYNFLISRFKNICIYPPFECQRMYQKDMKISPFEMGLNVLQLLGHFPYAHHLKKYQNENLFIATSKYRSSN